MEKPKETKLQDPQERELYTASEQLYQIAGPTPTETAVETLELTPKIGQ